MRHCRRVPRRTSADDAHRRASSRDAAAVCCRNEWKSASSDRPDANRQTTLHGILCSDAQTRRSLPESPECRLRPDSPSLQSRETEQSRQCRAKERRRTTKHVRTTSGWSPHDEAIPDDSAGIICRPPRVVNSVACGNDDSPTFPGLKAEEHDAEPQLNV